jgi:sec-independent protein translocase protein TatA
MLGNIGPLEIAIVLVVALIVFGPKRLPELGNGLGRGMREFKETVTGEKKDDVEEKTLPAATATAPAATVTAKAPNEPEAVSVDRS